MQQVWMVRADHHGRGHVAEHHSRLRPQPAEATAIWDMRQCYMYRVLCGALRAVVDHCVDGVQFASSPNCTAQ